MLFESHIGKTENNQWKKLSKTIYLIHRSSALKVSIYSSIEPSPKLIKKHSVILYHMPTYDITILCSQGSRKRVDLRLIATLTCNFIERKWRQFPWVEDIKCSIIESFRIVLTYKVEMELFRRFRCVRMTVCGDSVVVIF